MGLETINVTRWLNGSQEFVEVGTLFRDDSLDRKNPLIGFNYHPEYLDAHPRLLPDRYESKNGSTLLGGPDNKDMVPNYFKQFLPSERNKSVLNGVSDDFHTLDQFQQINYLTKFRGVFGSVQLNYDAEQQKNQLPKIKEAMALLDVVEQGDYQRANDKTLSAMYHPNSDVHVVSTFIEIDDNHVYCTIKKCKSEKEANELLFAQNLMNECGIESPLTIKLEQGDGEFFVGQIAGEQIINKAKNISVMFNTVPSAVLLADSGYISNFENINFAHINQAVHDSVEDVGAEVFKRALFTHLAGQKELSAKHFKIKEVGDGAWALAPQEVFNVKLDPNIPFNLALTDTISSYTHLKVNDALVDMVIDKYKLKREDVTKAINEVMQGFEKIPEIATNSGLIPSDVRELLYHVKQSELLTFNMDNSKKINIKGPYL